MKKLRLYLETSVWNFMFADDAPEKKEITVKFFEEVQKGAFEIYISELVIAEIDAADDARRDQLKKLIEKYQPFELTADSEVEELADKYLAAGIVPAKFENDVIHVAFAVANDLDVVVSWNLKHIVKLKTRLEVNGINKIHGYREVDLCIPEEVISDEE